MFSECYTLTAVALIHLDTNLFNLYSGLSQKSSVVGKGQGAPQRHVEEESSTLGEQESSLMLASLIEECEEYVRTEEFTKDLSSQILKLFMKERAQHEEDLYNHNANFDHDQDRDRDSYYDNELLKHEESPESVDSAYDSMDKRDNPFHGYHSQVSMTLENHHPQMSKSSSLSHFLEDDNISNASTIKNAARQFRDESISYDTVLREDKLQITCLTFWGQMFRIFSSFFSKICYSSIYENSRQFFAVNETRKQ